MPTYTVTLAVSEDQYQTLRQTGTLTTQALDRDLNQRLHESGYTVTGSREWIKPARRKYLHPDALYDQADAIAASITERFCENGSSRDVTRDTTPEERQTIRRIALSALNTINNISVVVMEASRRKAMDQAVIDMAEYTIDSFLHDVNGYDTIYIPLKNLLRDWELED